MNGVRPAHVQLRVILGGDVLSVGLFSHFDLREGVAAPPQKSDLRRRVFRNAVQHCDRREHRETARQAAAKYGVESRLLQRAVDVAGAMPRIGRGNPDDRLVV